LYREHGAVKEAAEMNTRLLSHPLNWITVWSMALVAFYVGHLLICFFYQVHPGAADKTLGNGSGAGVTGPGTADTTSSATNN
jgi:hypothetical protein